MSKHSYFVYIMASRSRALYLGVTSHLERRVSEHKTGTHPGFSKRYRASRLVYCEPFGQIQSAIAREKQIKRWSRQKKIELIQTANPSWSDLSDLWLNN